MNTMHRLCLPALFVAMCALPDPAAAHQDPEIAGYVKVDGGRIWYRLNGSRHLGKRPAIIVAHGGPGGKHRGNMSYVKLADTHPVILYDQLGTGNSDPQPDRRFWTVERFVGEIDHLRRALKLDKVIIAGHSWGGSLAAEYAVRNADGLRAAILSSPLINTKQWIADNKVWIAKLPKKVRRTLRKHEKAGTTGHKAYRKAEKFFYSRHMCRKKPCPNRHYRKDGPKGNRAMYLHMWGPSEFHCTGTLKDYDVGQRLPRVKVPTLMICGEFDEAAPKSCKRYAAMIRGATNVVVPDAGHATMAEDEVFYLKAVRRFLATVK